MGKTSKKEKIGAGKKDDIKSSLDDLFKKNKKSKAIKSDSEPAAKPSSVDKSKKEKKTLKVASK